MTIKKRHKLGIVGNYLLPESRNINFTLIAESLQQLTDDEADKVVVYTINEILSQETIKYKLVYKTSTISDLLSNISSYAYSDYRYYPIIELLESLSDFTYYSDHSKRPVLGEPPSAFIAQQIKKQFMYHFLGMYRKIDLFKANKMRRLLVGKMIKMMNGGKNRDCHMDEIYILYHDLLNLQHSIDEIIPVDIKLAVGRYRFCFADGYSGYLKMCQGVLVKALFNLEDIDNLIGAWEDKHGEYWDYRSKADNNEVYVKYINSKICFRVRRIVNKVISRKCLCCDKEFISNRKHCCTVCKNKYWKSIRNRWDVNDRKKRKEKCNYSL